MKKRKIFLLIFSILICICFHSIAYSALSTTMSVTGKAYARVEANARITDFRIKETIAPATSNYEEFTKDTISAGINFQEQSGSVIYTVEITNYGTNDIGIVSIDGLPDNLIMTTTGYEVGNKLCDDTNKCNTMSVKQFDIEISPIASTKSWNDSITLKFNFQPYYQISYVNINNSNYPTEVLGGTTLNLNMSDNPPKLTAVRNSSGKINSVYANNVLSVPNVNENIEIEAAYQTENTYYYVGGEQTFTTPHNGIYKIELWGAQGGYETVDPEYYPGAYGGYVSGEINLNKNTTLYVYVGEQPVGKVYNGGFNGGGNSAYDGSGGGGATDIRLDNSGVLDFNSLKSRIMIAAGGSGGYDVSDGVAGGLIGYKRLYDNDGEGGTQTSGGTGGDVTDRTSCVYDFTAGGPSNGLSENGSFGKGGNANYLGTGGGGGYYGGGSGTFMCDADGGGSGGGGSSFVSGHSGCDAISSTSTASNIVHTGQSIHYSGYSFINTKVIDGKGYNWTTERGEYIGMPTHDGTSTMVGNAGGGYAKITLLEIN